MISHPISHHAHLFFYARHECNAPVLSRGDLLQLHDQSSGETHEYHAHLSHADLLLEAAVLYPIGNQMRAIKHLNDTIVSVTVC